MLEDRATNVLSAVPPWRIIYGRAEVGCSIHAVFTKDKVGYRDDGTQYTKRDALHYMVCVFAAHQCAAWHDLKINNVSAGPFDANGWSLNSNYRLKESVRVYRETTLASGASLVEEMPINASSVYAYENVYVGFDAQPLAPVPIYLSPDRFTITNTQLFTVRVTYTMEAAPQSSLRVWFHDGDPDQTADATLMALFPEKWTANHRLRGRCYFVIMVDLEDTDFQSGPPQFTADLSGRLVYDPRVFGTAYTENNALCIRDFLMAKWGAEATASEIDAPLLAASANACDTPIDIKVDSYSDFTVYFDVDGAEGWVATNATLGNLTGPYRTLDGTGKNPSITNDGLGHGGNAARYVRARIRRNAGMGWRGKCYYKTAFHGYSENYRKDVAAGAAVGGDWVDIVFDMHSLTAGAGDWKNSTITGVRLCFGLGSTDNFDIEWIALSAYAEATESGPKYTLNGSFTTDQSREEVLNEMASSMSGFVTNSGEWKIVSGTWTAPVMDLGDDDLDGQIELVQADSGLEELVNGARGVYFKKGSSTAIEFDPYQNPTLLAADGEELWDEVSYPFTNNEVRARNLSRIEVERSRNGQIFSMPLKLHAWPITVGDRVRVSSSEYQVTLKAYRVIDWNFGTSSPVVLTLQEDTAETYDELDTTLVDPTPNTDMPNPAEVQDVEGLDIESGNAQLLRDADGTVRARAFVSWDAAFDAYLIAGSALIEIAWRRLFVDEPDVWRIQTAPATAINMHINGVREADLLVIRARYRNNAGVYGDAVFLNHTVLGKSEPPSDVTGLSAVMVEGGVRFTWDTCPEPDYLETEVRHGASWAAGTTLFRGAATSAFWPRPALGTYDIWAKHRDTSNIESFNAAGGSIGVSAGAISWTAITGRPTMYRVVSRGLSSVTHPIEAGIYNAESNTLIGTYAFMYHLLKIERSTGIVTTVGQYNPLSNGITDANAMAAAMNAISSAFVVVVFAFDEPATNRMLGNLPAAMYRCGASQAVFGSPLFKFRAAYILIGIAGCGEGQGYEAYQGSVDSDPNAWCDVTMQVLNGNFIISGNSATPRTLRDYAYTGDFDATKNIRLAGSGGMTINGNTAVRSLGTFSGAWDQHAYSLERYANGAFATARLGFDPSIASVMFGLTTDPLANTSYDTIDYAIYATATGIYKYINGAGDLLTAATPALGSTLSVIYDGHRVFFQYNGVTVGAPIVVGPDLALYFDSSFYSEGAPLDNIQFGPLSGLNDIDTPQIADEAATGVFTTTTGLVAFGTGQPVGDNQYNVSTITVGPFSFPTRVRASATFYGRVSAATTQNSMHMRICDLNTQTISDPPFQRYCQVEAGLTLDNSGAITYEQILPASTQARITLGGFNSDVVAPYGSSDVLNSALTVEVIKK
jgi:hypothetical protein